jgi:S-DNA-T family DNA segregation ATPase FtsK/SpoIIIE
VPGSIRSNKKIPLKKVTADQKSKSSPSMARKPRASLLPQKRNQTSPATKITSSRRQSPSTRKVSPANKRQERTHLTLPSWLNRPLSNERKLDIFGGFLALVGILTLIALLSIERGKITGWWITTIYAWTGWGALLMPLALVGVGFWLVFRNIERIPSVSLERVAGIVLFYLNFLAGIHWLLGSRWSEGVERQGGGKLGYWIDFTLIRGFGKPGALVLLAAWLIISLLFIFDLSVPDLLLRTTKIPKTILRPRKPRVTAPQNPPPGENLSPQGEPDLPPTFISLRSASQSDPGHSINQGSEKTASSTNAHISLAAPEAKAVPAPQGGSWNLPSAPVILDPASPTIIQTNIDQGRARLIEETLKSFGTPVHVIEIQHGPTITLFGVEPDYIETRNGRQRVRVGRIVSLADDLALALAAERIRIQAPVPGRNYVGIEVPNTEISRVSLSEVLESDTFKKMRSPIRFALGKDVSGKPIAVDLGALPHLLIAGTTGSGKSVCVNAILSCLLLNNTPQDLRLILVDPKRVELTGYNGIPHLLAPVVVDAERVIGALQWMLREMDSRYHKFSEDGVRNIQEYNKKHADQHLPYLVIVIDELADLMMIAPDVTERSITRLAQLARATGIHLILATQRPSVDVVTGLIKANFPARVSFAVASGIDSRVILDQPGAERLLGRGDMLFQAPDAAAPARLQGVYVSDGEISRLVNWWRVQAANLTGTNISTSGETIDTLPLGIPLKQTPLWDDLAPSDEDPLLKEAIDLVRREGRASITMLQRRMRIGYSRAARLVDSMEEKKIVGASQSNSQVREVLDYGPAGPPIDD